MLSLFVALSPTALAPRHFVFDTYQRLFPLERTGTPVAIVAIDENTLQRYGQWPWPRTRMAELFERISDARPASIGVDIFFAEPDRFSPASIAAELPLLDPEARGALAALPSNDERLAQAIRGRNVVLGISAETQPDSRFPEPPRAPPIAVAGNVVAGLANFPGHIRSLDVIDAAAAGRGSMNSGPADQVVRQVPLLVQVQGRLVPSLAVESLRVALDEAGMRVAEAGGGLLSIRFDQVDTAAQSDGTTWVRFGRHEEDRFVPAWAVMERRADTLAHLRDKVVLVGVNGLGVLDHKTTPLGEFVPGVEVHAQVIENLYNGVRLTRPEIAPRLEAVALLALGFLVIAYVPRLSALQGINVVLGMVVVLFGVGIVAFLQLHMLLDPLLPAIGLVAVFVSVVVGTLSEAEKQRRQLREQAARMAGEVDAARRIQMGLLPDPGETLAGDRRFKIAALLEPARTVGGDFYDCFMVDARRLFFVVADVAGKGLPAALFMASVKSHLKSAALRGGDLGEVLTRAQSEIALENPEQLFVTAFAASLDVQTGELEFANAGHEPPFLRSPAGVPERFGSPGGPPLCVIEDFRYPCDRRQLRAGDWLFVVTDGATEAMNPAREFFGLERLRTSLSWISEGATPNDIVRRLRDDVARFAAGAELADDITLLALRWEGGAAQAGPEAAGGTREAPAAAAS